uniref:Secreted protein n=1 Tax=Oryza glumipatula TaxID=40148 RepID=A0A0E0BLD7_9ORYZ
MHTTTTSFLPQTLLLLALVILPSTMADISDSTAPIGCHSCLCDEAAPPSASEGQMQLSIQTATGRRGSHPVIARCAGHPRRVGDSSDPSPLPGSTVHPPSTPCNYPGQSGCPH